MVKTAEEIIDGLSEKLSIRDAKDEEGNDIFTDKEKRKFNYDEVTDDNAKKVAKIMLKIKRAMAMTREFDKDLQNEIANEIIKGDKIVKEILWSDLLVAHHRLSELAKYTTIPLVESENY